MRVLVADDERDMALALEAMLKRENYSVDVVHDGRRAYEYGLTDNYDCLVLDIMMPKLDGIEVLKALREKGIRAPVLLLTAKSEPADRIHGLDEGADDYLPKPFVMGEFLARVRALTRRSTAFVPETLVVGDITLNRSTFELSSSKASVRLSNKEFQIMEALMRQQGRRVPTEQLIERIWGYDSATETNIIWTYMSYLRRKLDAIGSQAKIKASRSKGYTLEVPDVGKGEAGT